MSASDRRRFGQPTLLLHALKKANAPWRLAAALTAEHAPLAVTNNFLVATPVRYDGDLYYPLALLNSRLYNRIYTEHFPGVNIESYSVGSMPLPWPPRPVSVPTDRPQGTLASYWEWALHAVDSNGTIREDVYRWICDTGAQLNDGCEKATAVDHQMEAVLAGAFGFEQPVLDSLLEL